MCIHTHTRTHVGMHARGCCYPCLRSTIKALTSDVFLYPPSTHTLAVGVLWVGWSSHICPHQPTYLPCRQNWLCVLGHFSRVRLFATPWTVTCQAPLSMGFSRPEHWSGVPSSRRSSQPSDRTRVSYGSCIGRQVLTTSSGSIVPHSFSFLLGFITSLVAGVRVERDSLELQMLSSE